MVRKSMSEKVDGVKIKDERKDATGRERKGFFGRIRSWKTWQKVLLGIFAFLLVVIIATSVFVFSQVKRVDDFIAENFGTVETAAPVEEVARDPFIMYISGIDTRDGNLPEHARSDLNILAVVNPTKKAVMLVNVPRDYYVEMAGLSAMDKLTHAGDIGGLALSQATIEKLLDVKINYATRVNFNLLEGLVDAVGGVTVYSGIGTFRPVWNKNCVINYGNNELDGACAVAFSRERLAYGGDLSRARNQEAVITAVFEKVTRNKALLLNYGAILESLRGNFETSLSAEEVKKLASYVIADAEGWKVTEHNLETAGSGEEYGYLYPNERKFVFYVNRDSVNEAHEKIVEFMK